MTEYVQAFTRYSFDELTDRYADGDTTLVFTQTGNLTAVVEDDKIAIHTAKSLGGELWGTGTVIEVDTTIGKVYVDLD